MNVQNAQAETLPQTSIGWLRVASNALLRLTRAPRPTGKSVPDGAAHQARRLVVGVKKSAVCKDARGQLRRIDLFLPVDLVSELAKPLDIRFLDGDEPVTADELGKAIGSNFAKVGDGSV